MLGTAHLAVRAVSLVISVGRLVPRRSISRVVRRLRNIAAAGRGASAVSVTGRIRLLISGLLLVRRSRIAVLVRSDALLRISALKIRALFVVSRGRFPGRDRRLASGYLRRLIASGARIPLLGLRITLLWLRITLLRIALLRITLGSAVARGGISLVRRSARISVRYKSVLLRITVSLRIFLIVSFHSFYPFQGIAAIAHKPAEKLHMRTATQYIILSSLYILVNSFSNIDTLFPTVIK